MEAAYRGLEATTASGEGVSLTVPGFITAYALGSRRERIHLFTQAITALSGGEQRLSGANIVVFESELGQVEAELGQNAVLTWNGYQPADAEDLRRLRDLRTALLRILHR